MPSADQFLRLLEEKDLVPAHVVEAARREITRSSSPPDAVGISLWLVQGQHITASQAERLLAATADRVGGDSAISRWQIGPPSPAEAVAKSKPRPPEPPPPAKASLEDLELAPLGDEDGKSANKSAPPPAKSSPAAASATPATGKLGEKAAMGKKAGDKAKPPSIGGELESLETSMKGPLDSLIESEALEPSPFDDPAGAALSPAAPKKFKLRRWIRNLVRRSKSKTVTIKATDPRRVKILLFSWGVAAAVVIALLAAGWLLAPKSSDKILGAAEAAFDKQDYGPAIEQFDKYLAAYPKSPQVDEVRTLRVLAELRRAIAKSGATGDWTPASDLAQKQVKTLPNSPPRDSLKNVADALGKIGEGVARQTHAKPDMNSVGRLRTIAELIESETFSSVRPTEMLEGINRVLMQCKQEVEGRRQIESTVGDIRAAVANDETAPAYAAYRNLVELFPDLADDASVTAAMKEVAAVEQNAVRSGEQPLAAVASDRPSDLIAAMPLAVQPTRGELAGAAGKLRFVVEEGTAFGLDEATGKVLWRRFVALDPKHAAVTAVPIVEQAGSDVVLCDPVHREILRVKGRTGEIAWRLDVGRGIVGEAVRAGRSLLLVTEDKRLEFIDLATGAANHYLQLPQAVRLSPVVDVPHGMIYLVAEQANLYVFTRGKCQQVFHLGHAKGTIAALPTVVGDFLLVPVNDRADEATVRVLSIAKDDEPLQPVQKIRIKGYLNTPLAAMGDGAAVVTAQGGMAVLARDAAGGTSPFRVVARQETTLEEKAMHYVVSDGRAFWVTGKQLSRYGVEPDQSQIVLQKTSDAGAKFGEPPAVEGATMFSVVHRPGLPGATVSAVDLAKNEPVWQTWLAAPLAAAPDLGSAGGKITAVTASGGMFQIPPGELRAGAAPAAPVLAVGGERLLQPLTSVLALDGQRYAMTSGGDTKQIVIYDPQEQDKRFRWLLSPSEMSAAPGGFAGGILTPCVDGRVCLLDPSAREDMLAKPYVPSVSGATRWQWRTPQAAGDKLAVLCDGDRRVIALQIAQGDEPALAEAATASLSKRPLVSPLAVLGKTVYVVDSGDALLSYRLPDLSLGKPQELGGHFAWGPQRAGKLVLVATDKNRLIAVDEQQQVVWQADLRYGLPAGPPLVVGDDIFLVTMSGTICRLSAADGKEQGKTDAGCPLGTGPVLVGSRLIVGGQDGSLLEVKRP